MGQVLHGCARTTEAVRRAIQHSQASLNALAAQYGRSKPADTRVDKLIDAIRNGKVEFKKRPG